MPGVGLDCSRRARPPHVSSHAAPGNGGHCGHQGLAGANLGRPPPRRAGNRRVGPGSSRGHVVPGYGGSCTSQAPSSTRSCVPTPTDLACPSTRTTSFALIGSSSSGVSPAAWTGDLRALGPFVLGQESQVWRRRGAARSIAVSTPLLVGNGSSLWGAPAGL